MHFILKQKKIEKWDKVVADTEQEMSVLSHLEALCSERLKMQIS